MDLFLPSRNFGGGRKPWFEALLYILKVKPPLLIFELKIVELAESYST